MQLERLHILIKLDVRKGLENLFKSGLTHRILPYSVPRLQLLYKSEDRADCLVLSFHSDFDIVVESLDQLHSTEILAKLTDASQLVY